ncbi:hypothetical protein RCL1_009104 [Eukaryota sp. TZLM3-RCL]
MKLDERSSQKHIHLSLNEMTPTFIEDKSKRHVSLCKRRSGLVNMLNDFNAQFKAHALLVTVSEAGNGTVFGTESLSPVAHCPELVQLVTQCLSSEPPKV